MDRKDWLTMVYREANLFIEQHSGADGKLTETEVDELEPELHAQLQEVLKTTEDLEDIIKFSLLRNPPPDLWYGENNWQGVLVAVASLCILHDVKGIIGKIILGELPRTDSNSIFTVT